MQTDIIINTHQSEICTHNVTDSCICDTINSVNLDSLNEKDDVDDMVSDTFINDDMIFPKATIDPKLIALQKHVVDFIVSTILHIEKTFYDLLSKQFNSILLVDILGNTDEKIINMITTSNNHFYNKVYLDVQNHLNIQSMSPETIQDIHKPTDLTNWILEMSELAGYGAHILLDKLIRITINVHLDIVRESLVFNNYDLYSKSLLNQINHQILAINLLHIFVKSDDDDFKFVNVPDGKSPFNIVIDKNFKNPYIN